MNKKRVKKSKVRYYKENSGWEMKVDLPQEWLKEIGIDPKSKELLLTFDGKKITIEKASKKRLGKIRRSYKYLIKYLTQQLDSIDEG